MKAYKQKLKMRLLTAAGVFNEALVGEENGEFDLEIAHSGSRCLSDREMVAFFYLFRCEATYEDARRKLNRCFESDYPRDTVVKYGRRAIERMVKQVDRDKRLAAWIQRHRAAGDERDRN